MLHAFLFSYYTVMLSSMKKSNFLLIVLILKNGQSKEKDIASNFFERLSLFSVDNCMLMLMVNERKMFIPYQHDRPYEKQDQKICRKTPLH